MQNSFQIYAVDGVIIHEHEQENVILLIYAYSTEIAENQIRVYAQQHQLRLSYQFLPLPFDLYLQHHANPDFISSLTELVTTLSENNPVIIFNSNQYQESAKSLEPCLTKQKFLLREEDEHSPFMYQPIPRSMKRHLWQGNGETQCYAIINAAVSFWFPQHFEVEDIRSECLFKGEKAEKWKTISPYLLHLPENHPFVEQLCSLPPKPEKDGPQHWHKNFGFFFRSSADFDTLLHHFRKFVYMNTYDDNLLYFRFYDPVVLEEYFDFLQHYPRKLSTFWGKGLINEFILPKQENAVSYVPNIDFSQIEPAKKQFDKFEMKAMIEKKDNKLLLNLVKEIIKSTPKVLDYYSEDIIEKAVRHCAKIAEQYHLKETRTIGLFTLYSLACGYAINVLDPEKKVMDILKSDISELEKLSLIQERINELEQRGIIKNKLGENNEWQINN